MECANGQVIEAKPADIQWNRSFVLICRLKLCTRNSLWWPLKGSHAWPLVATFSTDMLFLQTYWFHVHIGSNARLFPLWFRRDTLGRGAGSTFLELSSCGLSLSLSLSLPRPRSVSVSLSPPPPHFSLYKFLSLQGWRAGTPVRAVRQRRNTQPGFRVLLQYHRENEYIYICIYIYIYIYIYYYYYVYIYR